MITAEEALKKAQQVRENIDAEKLKKEQKRKELEKKAMRRGVQVIKNKGEESINYLIKNGLSKGARTTQYIKVDNCEIDEEHLLEAKKYFEEHGYTCSIRKQVFWNGAQERYWSEVELTLGF